MKKVGIATLITGYNFGTSLQAFSMKQIAQKVGYEAEIIVYKDSLVKGRDIRIGKLFNMFIRTIWRPRLTAQLVKIYKNSYSKVKSQEAKELFEKFEQTELIPTKLSYREMKKIGKKVEYHAFICGSDQIWNPSTVYVNPLYFLRFAPENKRIAYAPSFGVNRVPDFNYKLVQAYLKEIPFIATREKQGKEIVDAMINRRVEVVLDPTLVLDKTFWGTKTKRIMNEKYILFYFLNEPSKESLKMLKNIQALNEYKVVIIPYKCDVYKEFGDKEYKEVGPFEFISLIQYAECICTDSFHGVAFSVNLNKPFFVFPRSYGHGFEQSSRITSLLSIVKLEDRYISKERIFELKDLNIDFTIANDCLNQKRERSLEYLTSALREIERH